MSSSSATHINSPFFTDTMEIVGLVAAVGSLAGTFKDAVECFMVVKLGREFDKGFKTAMIKLGIAE